MSTSLDDIIKKLVEVRLVNDNFLVVRETLQRIGIANKDKKLFQSCYLLQKRGKYYIVHFKKLFELDGKPSTFSDEDHGRENTIINLLRDWGLIEIVNPEQTKEPTVPIQKVKIIKSSERDQWTLIEKYTIGRKKINDDES